ncbi:hypothetical protein HanRHA438_Chr04g0157341 [Helianthus annuus]|uniref:Uncharacterized protein n=1 Tax=Helianthus annuus TaxID=4232 RepID=A0A9K3J544_HELAN|nr:hypothetical protein HanXRQr2_Chr04g0147271 [Helianthus annuus]KAJ0579741.1 hypothetical protein HanHA300_Chr04g0121231 [Helianthus annuus]KAJ0587037.1 hypothetical protein HanIR_Chr04g0158541 [Helianthus annuus]KAJ0595633.1 hypothetical protein HanHA89_Chr04g0133471 [Helianthus annuus]KAJ0756283.1 hypothetical protein HanLR1_Chr04g0125241 [Helianthus annuus]
MSFPDGGGDLGSVVSFLMARVNLVRRWVRDLVRFVSRVQVLVNRSQRFGSQRVKVSGWSMLVKVSRFGSDPELFGSSFGSDSVLARFGRLGQTESMWSNQSTSQLWSTPVN